MVVLGELVGNGPFVMSERGETNATLAANPFWSGPRGNVQEIAVDIRQPFDLLDEWDAGRHSFLFSLDLPETPSMSDSVLRSFPGLGVEYVGFSARPPFTDERVRKALAHGFDRARLLEEWRNQPALGGILPPAMPGHTHELALGYEPATARTLLAEAGFPDGRGFPELRLVLPEQGFGDETRRKVEAAWESQWRDLGVHVRLDWVPFESVGSEADADATMCSWGWVTDYPDPLGMLVPFLASSPYIARDDEVMSLLERARAARSRDERLRLCREADRRLVAEQAFVVPATYNTWFLLHRPWLDGFWVHPMGMAPLDGVVVRR